MSCQLRKCQEILRTTILSLTVDMTVFIEQVPKLRSVMLKHVLAYTNKTDFSACLFLTC